MITQYDDHAEKTEAAFAAFARVYRLTTPAPKPPASRRAITLSMIGLIVVTIAAVLVSGDRTIDEFGGWPRGVAAFAMLEVFAIVVSFLLTKLSPDGAHSKPLLIVALVFVLVIMVGANVHSIARSSGMYVSQNVITVILMLVAISAPVLTAINGHLTAVEWKANQKARSADMNAYEARLARWRDGLNAAWATNKGKYGVGIRVEREVTAIPERVPMERGTDRDLEYPGGTAGYSKTQNAMGKALEYYRSNPHMLTADPRTLEDAVGVKKSTLYRARAQVSNEVSNGN